MRQEEEDQWSDAGVKSMILSDRERREGPNPHRVGKINRFLECGEMMYAGGERE